jgi:hypothetical protein
MISARETFRLGNERLLRHCFSVGHLCSQRPSAAERLEAAVGRRRARWLIEGRRRRSLRTD